MSVGVVWYGSGWDVPTEDNVKGMRKPVVLTEMQQRSKERFKGMSWLERLPENPEDCPIVQWLIDNGRVYASTEGSLVEWAVKAINFAHDTDDPRKKAIYYDNDQSSLTYKQQCYAGWYDPAKWRNLEWCSRCRPQWLAF
jgi:hypothetical protein